MPVDNKLKSRFFRVVNMRPIIILLTAAVLFLNFPDAYAETPAQVSTLDGLIKMFDSSSCKECHETIYEQWEKSHHSRSLMGINDQMLLPAVLKRIANPGSSLEQLVKSDFPCFKCHFPQAKYASDAVAREIAVASLKNDKDTVRKLNIGCLVCHNEKAVVHGRPEKGVVYGSKDIPDHQGHPVKKSALLKNSLLCGQCHGLGPVLDSAEMPVQCATLYGSYLHAYIPSGGSQTCQDCHVKNSDHYMPPNFNNRNELSARLRESLPMEVQTLAYTFHPTEGVFSPLLVVKTKITNKAGHRIPDG
jgi:hypothetical protein